MSPGDAASIWLPLADLPQIEIPWDHRDADVNNWWLVPVARLKPGVPRERARAALNTVFYNSVFHDAKDVWKLEDAPALSLVPATRVDPLVALRCE